MKPDCYSCIHRQSIPGTSHSACGHPEALEGIKDNPLAEILAAFGSVGRGPGLNVRRLGVTADSHGVRMGWFNWPLNFDPIWLETCDGFEKKS